MCRKVLFLFPFILVQSLVAGPAIASLLALYEFDSNAIDSVGTNHGSKKGNPYYVAGVFGQAISFDGVGDYVDCGNSSAFNVTGVITVAAWIKMRAVNTDWQTIVAKGDSAWRLSTAQSTRRLHFAVDISIYTYCLLGCDSYRRNHANIGLERAGQRYFLIRSA